MFLHPKPLFAFQQPNPFWKHSTRAWGAFLRKLSQKGQFSTKIPNPDISSLKDCEYPCTFLKDEEQ